MDDKNAQARLAETYIDAIKRPYRSVTTQRDWRAHGAITSRRVRSAEGHGPSVGG
jgi:hypothetical protein